GQPLSEALLMGIAGGITAGYFVFEYEGSDPSLHFLTYHLYNGAPTILYDRLGIKKQTKQTDSGEKAFKNLDDALQAGKPAVMWADMFSLTYNNLPQAADMWGVMPLIVYGHEGDTVHIADRARVPLTADTAEFGRAWGRVASEKHRLMTVAEPDFDRLPAAVEAGIRECLQNMLGEPPKAPMKGKFGLDAFTRWADMLINPKEKNGWPKKFTTGARLYNGLVSTVQYIDFYFTGGCGARGVYADFLDEAARILGKPALQQAAQHYRAAVQHWSALTRAALPDDIDLLRETRELMQRRYDLFVNQGAEALPERQEMRARLNQLREQADTLNETQAAALRENLRVHVLAVHDAEKEAALALQAAIDPI
ncbi:MAG: DUF4872 domain-containing protein, partial [Anaerolineae bacterium]|nr:DUF4872 domain-containing protein [Anaerolineae bacterium]